MTSAISSLISSSMNQMLERLSSSTTANSSSSLSKTTDSSNLSASSMFSKLTKELGGDGESISKEDLENYIQTVKDDTTGTYDKGSLGFLNQLYDNWSNISDTDTITEAQMQTGLSYLQPPTGNNSNSSNDLYTDLYTSILNQIDADGDGTISASDLQSYISELDSMLEILDDDSKSGVIGEKSFMQDLLDAYDDYADDESGIITSSSFYAMLKEPQDVSTVTSEQLTGSIDLRV